MSHTDYSGDEPLLEDGYDDLQDADDWSYEEPRKRRARSCLPVLLVLVILGSGLFFGGRWAYDELSTRLASAPDFEGPGSGEVVYQVEEGVTSAQIGRDLKEAGVVASVDAFTEAATLDEDSRNIQVGYYQLQEKMRASDALDVLVDPANLVQALVTVPEGARVRQVVDSIAKNTDIRRRAVVRALADAEAIGLPADAEGNPEGYLFPATYTVPPKMTAVELISQMVAKTKAVEADLDIEARAADLGLTPEQVLTVASILEYEANKSEDYPRVARVLYNRLDDDMALQLDSTVSYVSGRSGDVWTTSAERDSDSQYNTYKYTGLPPGPIGSPGQETIEAALEPAEGDWLFFVPDYEADTTRFSVTLAEHNRWVEKLREYCRNNEDC
ncbi:endolytic transglycosylase MltG [Nocardioides aurantiacus]|uniref:Endolytic murein transglycosylase n=1 Tax=Nocardioides aurantiacus TaxID=86796 RepID=A0A3N2CSV5_9ACTN|nr:endolytic transglycosylase MltG [Nocardioides aurantiacus]ROR90585.1 UPF0755 protein [Nocardioides aurantiacus]